MLKSGFVVAAAAFISIAAVPAHAIDDRYNPHSYEKGGFAPITDAQYKDECGSCHFTYLPGMLPARSWHALMARANDHFGESLSLKPELAAHLEKYLTENAADHTDYLGSERILDRLADNATPLRITSLPVFRGRHFMVAYQLKLTVRASSVAPLPPTAVKGLMNCGSCHEKAQTGSFAEKEILVQGLSKVVKPGDLF